MSLLFYRRPDYVAKLPGQMSLAQCQVYVERTQKHKRAIPPELSFENVIQNKALPVITPPRLVRSVINLPILKRDINPGMLKASIALHPARFHGLPRLRLPRRRKPPILPLAARLHQTLLCRTALRTSSFPPPGSTPKQPPSRRHITLLTVTNHCEPQTSPGWIWQNMK